MGVLGRNRGRGGAILTLNELVLTFRGSYVRADCGENRSRNATVRVLADGQTHTHTPSHTHTHRRKPIL